MTFYYRVRGFKGAESKRNGRIVHLKYLQSEDHPNLEGPLSLGEACGMDLTISLYSVPYRSDKRIYAFVPGGPDEIGRLRADDPIWDKNVAFHWSHSVDPASRVRPRRNIRFVIT